MYLVDGMAYSSGIVTYFIWYTYRYLHAFLVQWYFCIILCIYYIIYRYLIFNERPFASLWSWDRLSGRCCFFLLKMSTCRTWGTAKSYQFWRVFVPTSSAKILKKVYFPFYQGYTLAFGFLAGRRLLPGKWSRKSIGIHFSRFSGTATILGV